MWSIRKSRFSFFCDEIKRGELTVLSDYELCPNPFYAILAGSYAGHKLTYLGVDRDRDETPGLLRSIGKSTAEAVECILEQLYEQAKSGRRKIIDKAKETQDYLELNLPSL